MKKILLALVGLCFASSALAGPLVAPHRVDKLIPFRTHKSTIVGNETGGFGVDNLGGYVDSVYITNAAKFDTTVGFITAGLTTRPSATSADSVTAMVVNFFDAGSSSTSSDSLYIQAQGSVDGKSWTDLVAVPGQAAAAKAYVISSTVNGSVFAQIPLGGTGAAGKIWRARYVCTATSSLKSANDVYSLLEWPQVRWIVKTQASTTVNIGCKVSAWSAEEDLNR